MEEATVREGFGLQEKMTQVSVTEIKRGACNSTLTLWTDWQHWIDPVLQEPSPPPRARMAAGVATARRGRAREVNAARRAYMVEELRE